MQIERSFAAAAGEAWPPLAAVALALALAGCARPDAPPSAAGAAPPSVTPSSAPSAAQSPQVAAPVAAPAVPSAPVPPAVPFDQAVTSAANALFAGAKLPEGGGAAGQYDLVIDPLLDGVTGAQTAATRSIQRRILDLVRERYPQYRVQPLSTETISRQPLVLVGTFTPVNAENRPAGKREAYRICLVLADLKSGKTVGKGTARALMEGVDATPAAFFQDSPVWAKDARTEGYISTCQGTRPGDPINQAYLDSILAAALLGEAIEAYDTGSYDRALGLYRSALQANGGDQLRAYNGVYLTNWKLGRRGEAEQAFRDLVDYGLRNNRLAVKLLFKPGSTAFVPDPEISDAYGFWLRQIAQEGSRANACLEVAGHTSPTGPTPLNDRLSQLRAEYVKSRLENEAPELSPRLIAAGMGSRENLVGTGRDDATDALDRRVEFRVIPAC